MTLDTRPATPTRARSARAASRRLAVVATSALALLGLTAPAAAGTHGSGDGFDVLCEGAACLAELPRIDRPGTPGEPFAFALGLKAHADGLVLDVRTDRSIYIRGSLATQGGDITLRAGGLRLDGAVIAAQPGAGAGSPAGDITITADEIILDGPGISTGPGGAGDIQIGAGPPVVPGIWPPPTVTICACISVIDPPDLEAIRLELPEGDLMVAGDVGIRGGSLVLAATVLPPPKVQAQTATGGTPGSILVDEAGDVYLDVTLVDWFDTIELDAGEEIVLVGPDVVPEPGTALLLGLGLAGLAARRS